ncbi:uncharacterized protein LOC113126186 isoform X2 [Mastacembelus armatus]|uniref:uncharacterized protein LOC113126186 isoform X2 n=1 Tax=Mastacembelus armatus TaxID=205130 RepID=UPI000E4624F5|nr:uncharacterized protein LOC113126186 isoform X2 [Mastacembelus armatus]
MEHDSLGCQVCLTKFNRVSDLKGHVRSLAHRQKMKEVFREDVSKGSGLFPFIFFMDHRRKCDVNQPILGLSLLTLCFSPRSHISFYLCHVCEEMCSSEKISRHLSSGDHCSNYFNYTDPNALSFSWIPSINMGEILRPQVTKELNERGQGTLQVLELPEQLLKELQENTYSGVMCRLSENNKLLKLLDATKPQRTMIQTYQRDSNRKHPLLGMQHLIECIGVGQPEKRYYLCTLCNLTLATHMIIKHVVSFDHIFCYFKAWHPSTLMSKECYIDYTQEFISTIYDFTKQTEEIYGSTNNDMKQVSLDPDKFTSVNFTCYAEALKKLESITKENNGSSLITSIKPGQKLVERGREEDREDKKREQDLNKHISNMKRTAVSKTSLYKLRCQKCSYTFNNLFKYLKHLPMVKHQQMLRKFDCEADDFHHTGCNPSLDLYSYLHDRRNQPVIGVSLVVACVSSQVQMETIYVCFACEECFSDSCVKEHFESTKHLLHTLLYHNPWRLPFGWEDHLDLEALKSMAWEEEKDARPTHNMLKVLDIPFRIFSSLLPPSYQKVRSRLGPYTFLKHEVPQRKTYTKLDQNERFPLLGNQFLVMYDACDRWCPSTEVRILCLLCKRILSDTECYAHVFSREHVATFLNCFHPGSLNSSTDAETLLDLAKQAAQIHFRSYVQKIKLAKPIWEPCSYHKVINIIASAKRREGKGALEPTITTKQKLVSRKTLKEVDKGHVKDSSQTLEDSEKSNEKFADNDETKLEKLSVKVDPEITEKNWLKSEENVEKGANKETLSSSEDKSEAKLSETNSEMKNKDIETCQVIKKIKEEEIEEPITRKPNTEVPESSQNTEYNDTETRKGTSKSSKILPKLNNYMNKKNDKKRPNIMSENSQESTCLDGVAGREMEHKRQRLTFKCDSAGEEPHNIPSSGLKEVTTADKGDSGKSNHNTANDNALSNMNHQTAKLWQYIKRKDREPLIGLSLLLECICDLHDPIYLCECCCMKIPEEHIVSHVTGSDHQKMFLMGLQNFPLPPGMHQKKEIRHMAALLEQEQGYGEAQVIDMDEENYNNLLKQNFNSAIQTIKAHQTQQNSGREFTSTPSLSGPQSTNTSVTLHSQQKVCSIMDKNPMVKIDDSDVRTQPSSIAMTETTLKTTGVNTESAKHVKRIHIKVPEACDSAANIFLTGYRSSEDVYKSGTSATTLHPYFSGNNSEDKIAPNTALDPLKIAAISKVVATSRPAATPYPTVTTPNTPMRPTSSSTTATTKVRETANKGTVTTSNANSSATQLNTANLNFGAANIYQYIPTITKSAAAPPICTVTASAEHTILSSTPTGTTPSSTMLNTALATKSVSKPLECRPSQTGSSVVHEVMSRTVSPSRIQNTSKNAETAGRATVASLATNKVAEASVTCKNTNAKKLHTVKNSEEANADVAPHVHKTNPPAGSEHKNPSSESSHTFPAKIKPRESLPKVGLNQLIAVSCDRRQQIYCQLCSVRLRRSTHMFNVDHQYNYVKLKYPEWSARPTELERKLDKAVAQLAELERDTLSEGMQMIEVTRDVYKELAGLPDEQALERVKAMIRQRDLEGSSSTKDTRESLTQQVTITSPCEISSPGDVQVEQYGCEDPAATTSKSAAALAQIPGAWEENRQQDKSDPELQTTEKTLPLISLSSDLCSFTASVNTKQQNNQSRPSPRAEHVLKHLRCSPEPGHHNDSQALPEILAGELLESCSNLSFYLSVNHIVAEPIIGLGCVWECRGMALKPEKSFYLCDCCEEKLSKNDICRHLTTADHQLKYLRAHRPQYQTFWMDDDIQHEHKLEILKEVVQLITELEPYNTVDAKVILLSPSFYEFVRSASFSEALKFVQQIKTERKMRVFCPVPSTPQQKDKQPENRQSREEPLQMGMLECETDQTRNIEASQTTDKPHLEETLMSGGLDGAKCRRVSTPFNVDILSSKADSVVSPFPGAGTCMRSELSPAASQLQIKQAEKHSESPSLAPVNPQTHVTPSLSVSLRDKFIPTRKRRASMEAPIFLCSSIAQLEGPLAAKCARSSLDSVSTSTTPTMTSTPQCPNDRDAGSVMCEQLVALVRETKNKINVSPRKSANISALNSSSLRDILFKATEVNVVGTMVPSPSTADPRDPQRSFGAQSTPGNSDQLKPRPEYCAATKNNPGQVSRPQDDQARVCQLPITPIITVRQDPTKEWFMGGYKGQHHCQLTRGVQHSHNFTALSTPNPINDTLAASGGHAQYSQMPYVSGLQGYLSSETTAGCPTSDNPTAYNGHLYQGEASTAMGLHSGQIYLNQETGSLQSFGDSLATPAAPQWISPEMLLYHHQQQQQQQQQQQLLMLQQQYFPWEAALTGTFPFTTPASNSQRLIGQNEYNQQHHSNSEQQKPNDTE